MQTPVSRSPFYRALAGCLLALPLLSTAAGKSSATPATAPSAPQASGSYRADGVDSLLVHKYYMDGEFDPAIAMLESDLGSRKNLSHDDSVFIFKHLGVMYAANYETRERGKLYMHKLLMVEPTVKIMDMYASDMIYMIFKNIQDEFQTNRARIIAGDTVPQTTKQPAKPNSTKRIAFWVGGAAVVGIGAYFLITVLTADNTRNHGY